MAVMSEKAHLGGLGPVGIGEGDILRIKEEEAWKRQKEIDDAEIQKFFQPENPDAFNFDRPLEVGEKADDAEDFSDIDDDDDLPEEEYRDEAPPGATDGVQGPGLIDDTGTSADADDDLFGDGEDGLFGERMSSPVDGHDEHDPVVIANDEVHIPSPGLTMPSAKVETLSFKDVNFDPEPKPRSDENQDLSIPAPAESAEDFLKVCWPKYEKGKIIDWNTLLPPKSAHYVPRRPEKVVKAVHPTKVSLDLAQDQEKLFRTAGPATSTKPQRVSEAKIKNLIPVIEDDSEAQSSTEELDFSSPAPDEIIGNVTYADLEMICDDWEARFNSTTPEPVTDIQIVDDIGTEDAAWLAEMGFKEGYSRDHKRKRDDDEIDFTTLPSYEMPSFDDFEVVVQRAAKTVILDMNDPHLLLDVQGTYHQAKRRRGGDIADTSENGNMSKAILSRFNISNDEAYDALKENHQSKVRAVIGSFSIEHSMPAKKLQWPYYRVKLYTKDARAYHRPALKFNRFCRASLTFTKPLIRKRKGLKGLSVEQLYQTSGDLSLADNSTAMLLEYSEEHPTVLSNFGMGNRIINYYRRTNNEDTTRPKLDVGETSLLLPEDRSPFSQFGTVDPGETVPTLHNGMYRAPVFKQEVKGSDFLMLRSTTGVDGTSWYIRNVDHLFVVGQQLPSVEIPGPQSRKFTNAAKNRMRMIAFRKMRHSPNNTVRIDEITSHIMDSTDMQNRQKLKEFIKYHKEEKVWRVKPGDSVPDEMTVRSWVKPEDVCTIDAMQVGLRHLEDAGYGKTDLPDDEGDANDEDDKETDSLEQKLAPWKTTKNFLDASAGKAMLALHGEGDPSGRGLAFSFIKTSMKGGYLESAMKGPQMTSADHIAQERKANGGHKYNVEKQNEAYNEAIKDIWEKQKETLSNVQELDDDADMDHPLELEDAFGVAATPSAPTPARFDDSVSQFSRMSASANQAKSLRIVRQVKNKFGGLEESIEVVRDPRVWREYLKRRHALDADKVNVYEVKPTGDAEFDRKEAARIKKELARLERNKERRHAREKQKGTFRASAEAEVAAEAGSPGAAPLPEKQTGTTRKCANCGQAGHIKTNKKLCPLLNGTLKAEDTGNGSGFGAIAPPAFGA